MTNADKRAFPMLDNLVVVNTGTGERFDICDQTHSDYAGLTKREVFTLAAMVGLLIRDREKRAFWEIALDASVMADEQLRSLAELAKERETPQGLTEAKCEAQLHLLAHDKGASDENSRWYERLSKLLPMDVVKMPDSSDPLDHVEQVIEAIGKKLKERES